MRHWDATGKWRAMQQQQQEYALCATVEGSSSLRARAVTGSIPITSTNQCEGAWREHYGVRYLKGFKTATSKCAKSRSFRVATVRP